MMMMMMMISVCTRCNKSCGLTLLIYHK